ncbi:hypothetical protein L195_g046835 [Trifolium pratense]|uniref:Uncharacterized protein n=1 Tax=Trifolium pratense TaxID=57577 RepID=A0A2K3MIT1_TRIPR|nr:hypothetical protein L195_g046835 [Trifolium pratense]
MCMEKVPSNGYGGIDIGETKSDFVEVFSIGGRKDAVFYFFLNSPFQFSSLHFWIRVCNQSRKRKEISFYVFGVNVLEESSNPKNVFSIRVDKILDSFLIPHSTNLLSLKRKYGNRNQTIREKIEFSPIAPKPFSPGV